MRTPIETAEALYAALEGDEIEPVLALCTDDVEVDYPVVAALPYGGRWHGPEGMAAFLEAHDAAEEILEFAPGPMVADGATVLVRGHFRGRTRTSGREWTTEFVHVLEIRDERLARWQAYFDTAAALTARSATVEGSAIVED